MKFDMKYSKSPEIVFLVYSRQRLRIIVENNMRYAQYSREVPKTGMECHMRFVHVRAML